jgi:ketosteroid isomerase-like protein
MSQENVELFRRGTDALEHGDVALLEELADPEVIFEPLRAPVSGTYRGHEGIRRFLADTAESFDIFRFDRPEMRDLGDRVLAIGTLHIRAREGASRRTFRRQGSLPTATAALSTGRISVTEGRPSKPPGCGSR